MADPISATAPAQPDSTATATATPQTAAQQAGASGDFGAYEKARFAESSGTPLAPAPELPRADEGDDDEPPAPLSTTTTPATPVPAPSKPISKRQQQINDYERQLAESRAEIARLKAPPQEPARREPDRQPAPAPAPTFPDYADYLETHPGASLETWVREQYAFLRHQERQEETRQAEVQSRTEAQHERVATFSSQIEAETTARPDFLAKLRPEILALRPIADLGLDEKAGPENIVADLLIDSPRAPALMQHLSDHPEDLRRITAIPPRLQHLRGAALASAHVRQIHREMTLLEGRLTPADAPAAPATPAPKTITSAPDPPFTLGKKATTDADPEKSAVATGDYTAYERAKFASLRAARR